MSTHTTLYEQDFYAWTQEQATLLEARQWEVVDLPHLVEEIITLGASERRALGSHLKQLVMHLLKWYYPPEGRQTSQSWRASIRHARDEITQILEESPSLQGAIPTLLARRYRAARLLAHDETGWPLPTFPETCPWTVGQILTEDFWPDA